MKKIILTILVFLMAVSNSFADTVYDTHGSKVTGKIDSAIDGYIQLKKDGNIIRIFRKEINPIYKDIVLVRKHFISRSVIKYSGQVIFADNWMVRVKIGDEMILIPRNRVNEIIMFAP